MKLEVIVKNTDTSMHLESELIPRIGEHIRFVEYNSIFIVTDVIYTGFVNPPHSKLSTTATIVIEEC